MDNLNNVASIQEIINFAIRYREARPADTFILGSINRISDPRQTIATIELLPFNSAHCSELLASKDIDLSEGELQSVMHRTGGLPLFIGMIANYRGIENSQNSDFSTYFIQEIYLRLKADERELLLFLCVCNLSRTTLSPDNLVSAEFPYVDAKLGALRKYSAIIWTKTEFGNQIKAHDLIRDIVLRQESNQVSTIARRVADFFFLDGDKSSAVLPALLADSSEESMEWLTQEIRECIKRKDYPVVINWWENLTEKASSLSLFAQKTEIREILLLAYLRALLGIGTYHKARHLTESSIFRKVLSSRPGSIRNKQDYQLQVSLSDLDHLLNNYTLARSSIEFIISECKRHGWIRELAETRWLWAHLTGHIGADLAGAVEQYSLCQSEADDLQDELLAVRAYNGSLAIEFTMNGGEAIQESILIGKIEAIADIPGNGPTLSALYRNLSRLHRLRGNPELASEAVEKSAQIARQTGLRTLINCDYARAENARFEGRFADAVPFYLRVIEATSENGDDNLRSSAKLAIAICDICLGAEALHYKDSAALQGALREIEELSDKYNMLITKARVGAVRGMMDSGERYSEQFVDRTIMTLDALGLKRDVALIKDESRSLRRLEIHVH